MRLPRRRPVSLLLATAFAFAALAATASAYQFGTPDASFGAGGIVNYKPPVAYGAINAVAVQPDGKIVAAGIGDTPAQGWVARFASNGTLDTGFGTGGVASFSTSGFERPEPHALAIQPDGKIVVAGTIKNSTSGLQWRLLYRLNSDGTLDTSSDSTPSTCFGSGCLGYILSVASGHADFNDVKLLSSGDILAAGTHLDSGTTRPDLLRYASDGTTDATFNGNSATELNGFSVASADPPHIRVLPTTDGSFIVAFGNASGKFAAVKLNANGTIFSGFGMSGSWAVGSNIGMADATLRPNGSILFVGAQDAVTPSQILALGGIDKDGETDTTIGAGGISSANVGNGERTNGMAVRVLADGRFFVLTLGYNAVSNPFVLSSVFKADGQLDPSYGTGGTYRHSEIGAYNYPTALELLPGDKPLIAGTLFDLATTTNYGFLMKLHGPNDPDPPILAAAKIKTPGKSKYRAKKLTKFTGTSTPSGQVAKVEIALQRVDSKLLKKKKQCLWLSSNKAKFKKVKAVKKKCSAPRWLKATGTGNWSYKLKKKLPKGSYVLSVRATASDGTVQARPATKKFKIN